MIIFPVGCVCNKHLMQLFDLWFLKQWYWLMQKSSSIYCVLHIWGFSAGIVHDPFLMITAKKKSMLLAKDFPEAILSVIWKSPLTGWILDSLLVCRWRWLWGWVTCPWRWLVWRRWSTWVRRCLATCWRLSTPRSFPAWTPSSARPTKVSHDLLVKSNHCPSEMVVHPTHLFTNDHQLSKDSTNLEQPLLVFRGVCQLFQDNTYFEPRYCYSKVQIPSFPNQNSSACLLICILDLVC